MELGIEAQQEMQQMLGRARRVVTTMSAKATRYAQKYSFVCTRDKNGVLSSLHSKEEKLENGGWALHPTESP